MQGCVFLALVFMYHIIIQHYLSYVADLVTFCMLDPQRLPLRSASARAAVI